MKHITFEYDPKKRELNAFHNGKPLGGYKGPIAERKWNELQKEAQQFNSYLNHALKLINGTQAKTKKI